MFRIVIKHNNSNLYKTEMALILSPQFSKMVLNVFANSIFYLPPQGGFQIRISVIITRLQ